MAPVCLSYHGGGYGGGWYGPQDLREWLHVAWLTLQFPLATWQMSNYDGSLVAVLFATVCLPLLARRMERQPLWPRDKRLDRDENPFDALAEHAIEEDRAGRTRSLREFAREQNIPLNDE